MDYNESLAKALAQEILDVIDKYEESMLVTTVIGVLEIIKADLMADLIFSQPEEDDDD